LISLFTCKSCSHNLVKFNLREMSGVRFVPFADLAEDAFGVNAELSMVVGRTFSDIEAVFGWGQGVDLRLQAVLLGELAYGGKQARDGKMVLDDDNLPVGSKQIRERL
jgi:hypothetical protein